MIPLPFLPTIFLLVFFTRHYSKITDSLPTQTHRIKKAATVSAATFVYSGERKELK